MAIVASFSTSCTYRALSFTRTSNSCSVIFPPILAVSRYGKNWRKNHGSVIQTLLVKLVWGHAKNTAASMLPLAGVNPDSQRHEPSVLRANMHPDTPVVGRQRPPAPDAWTVAMARQLQANSDPHSHTGRTSTDLTMHDDAVHLRDHYTVLE